MFNLIPKNVRFFDEFEEQSANIKRAAGLLHDLTHDFADARAKAYAIKTVEHEGDLITHQIVKQLNTTFITPLGSGRPSTRSFRSTPTTPRSASLTRTSSRSHPRMSTTGASTSAVPIYFAILRSRSSAIIDPQHATRHVDRGRDDARGLVRSGRLLPRASSGSQLGTAPAARLTLRP